MVVTSIWFFWLRVTTIGSALWRMRRLVLVVSKRLPAGVPVRA